MSDLLYVCSPYRGDTKRNKEYARKLTRAAINNGFVPVTVHLYLTEVTDDQNPEERSRGMAAGMKILENCKYILIGNKYGVSDGMKAEMTLAALKGKVMLYEQDGKIYLVDSREETTEKQDWWLEQLRQQGYETAVCWSAEEAMDTIAGYLGVMEQTGRKVEL